MNLTIPKLKRFAADPTFQSCASAVLMATAFAQMERERVNAYILPLFAGYKFTIDKETRCESRGQPITNPNELYLSNDEALCAEYYADCDHAHREHGFNGPKGHCPALMAENLLIVAENNLLGYALAELQLGFDRSSLWGDKRKKMLDLLLGLAVNSKKFKAPQVAA